MIVEIRNLHPECDSQEKVEEKGTRSGVRAKIDGNLDFVENGQNVKGDNVGQRKVMFLFHVAGLTGARLSDWLGPK